MASAASPEAIVADLVRRANESGQAPAALADSLIGLFQAFRPAGLPADLMLDKHQGGLEFRHRLQAVYDTAGSPQRHDGMRDAYFIVRQPTSIDPRTVSMLATQFVVHLRHTCDSLELDHPLGDTSPAPAIRVLEGKAPKHPKDPAEKAALLRLVEGELPEQFGLRFTAGSLGELLAEALYFIACDAWLRDYLRWPLLAEPPIPAAGELLHTYFELWRHGIKFRIFNDRQIDFYIPRQCNLTLG